MKEIKLKRLKLKGKAIIANNIDQFKLLFLDAIKSIPNYETKRLNDTPLLKSLYFQLVKSVKKMKLDEDINTNEIFIWCLNSVYNLNEEETSLLSVLINQFESDYLEKEQTKNKIVNFFSSALDILLNFL